MAYRNNSSKIWNGILAVLLVLVLAGTAALVGVLSDGFKNWDKFKTEEEQTEETTDNGAPVIGENGEELPSGEAIPMPKAMAFRSAAALDGRNAEYDSVTLTATVTPSNADNKKVDWTIAFANPASEWASGKTVTDYVTVTPESDGSLTATVQCLQDFGEQIIITVTSRDNSNAKATCTVDFYKRVVGLSANMMTFLVGNDYDDSLSFTPSDSYLSFDSNVMGIAVDFCSYQYSNYTLDDSFTDTYTGRGTEEMLAKLQEGGIASADLASPDYSSGGYIPVNRYAFTGFDAESDGFMEPFYSIGEDELEAALLIAAASTDVPIIQFEITVEGSHSSVSYVWDIYCSTDGFHVSVNGISLDDTAIEI